MTKARDLANGGFGLVLVKPSSVVNGTDNGKGTVSFSAASSVSLNDVFSATYENYRIVIAADSSVTSTSALLRLRVSGADNTSANYIYDRGQAIGNGTFAGFSSGTSAAATAWDYGAWSGTYSGVTSLDIFRPFATDNTGGVSLNYYVDSLPNHGIIFSGLLTTVTTSYTGFTIYPGSGTFTGTVSVYGYNK